jgi:hypothetical protein
VVSTQSTTRYRVYFFFFFFFFCEMYIFCFPDMKSQNAMLGLSSFILEILVIMHTVEQINPLVLPLPAPGAASDGGPFRGWRQLSVMYQQSPAPPFQGGGEAWRAKRRRWSMARLRKVIYAAMLPLLAIRSVVPGALAWTLAPEAVARFLMVLMTCSGVSRPWRAIR